MLKDPEILCDACGLVMNRLMPRRVIQAGSAWDWYYYNRIEPGMAKAQAKTKRQAPRKDKIRRARIDAAKSKEENRKSKVILPKGV